MKARRVLGRRVGLVTQRGHAPGTRAVNAMRIHTHACARQKRSHEQHYEEALHLGLATRMAGVQPYQPLRIVVVSRGSTCRFWPMIRSTLSSLEGTLARGMPVTGSTTTVLRSIRKPWAHSDSAVLRELKRSECTYKHGGGRGRQVADA